MSIEEQKKIAEDIINKLRAIDPYVILAGGAPRDWHLGEEASDLDFYLHLSGRTQSARSRQLVSAFGSVNTKWCQKGTHDSDLYKTMQFLHSIYETEVGGLKIQIMNLNQEGDTFKVVDAMSCSICKAWWTPERGVVRTNDFKMTETTKLMFLSDGYSWSDPHPTKMLTKFSPKGYSRARSKEFVINTLLESL